MKKLLDVVNQKNKTQCMAVFCESSPMCLQNWTCLEAWPGLTWSGTNSVQRNPHVVDCDVFAMTSRMSIAKGMLPYMLIKLRAHAMLVRFCGASNLR